LPPVGAGIEHRPDIECAKKCGVLHGGSNAMAKTASPSRIPQKVEELPKLPHIEDRSKQERQSSNTFNVTTVGSAWNSFRIKLRNGVAHRFNLLVRQL